MAVCPKCSGPLDARAVVCPGCGYDFPSPPERQFAPLWLLLVVAGVAAGAVILADDHPTLQVVLAVFGLVAWVGLLVDVRRLVRWLRN